MKNWKTNIAGLSVLLVVVAVVFGHLTGDQAISLIGALGGGGLILAKDADK